MHIALLRAVNVGGRKLAMVDLRAVLTEIGFTGVQSLLQSGNVVFRSSRKAGAMLERWLALVFVFLELLGEVVGDTHFADGMQLRFQPVDVVLFVVENGFRQRLGGVIALRDA